MIGITGAAGLLGYHYRAYLRSTGQPAPAVADRAVFDSEVELRRFVRSCSAIIHLAGVNRGDPELLEAENLSLATRLVAACQAEAVTPHVVYSSTTHVDRDTPYGRSKRRCGELFAKWAAQTGAKFTNCILPHVFGEFGRPNYNSVVATFAFQLANRQQPSIDADGQLELLHGQEVAQIMDAAVREGRTGELRPPGQQMGVSALLERMRALDSDYRDGMIPDLAATLDVRLFNVYRAWLFPAEYPRPLLQHADARGSFCETVRARSVGQTSYSTSVAGVTRGNHFHTRKFERFVVVSGEGLIRLRKLFDDRIFEMRVSGAKPAAVDMPTFHTHSITNIGSAELVTEFWSNEFFDPENSDTVVEPLSAQ